MSAAIRTCSGHQTLPNVLRDRGIEINWPRCLTPLIKPSCGACVRAVRCDAKETWEKTEVWGVFPSQ